MRRPEGVTIIAMWYFLSASVCVLGLGALAIGLLGIWSQHSFQDIIFGTMGMMLAVVAVSALAVAYGVTSWALWRLKPWARSASIVLAILQLILIPVIAHFYGSLVDYRVPYPHFPRHDGPLGLFPAREKAMLHQMDVEPGLPGLWRHAGTGCSQTSRMAVLIACTACRNCSAVMQKGGIKTTTSRIGRVNRPCWRAARQTAAPSWPGLKPF